MVLESVDTNPTTVTTMMKPMDASTIKVKYSE